MDKVDLHKVVEQWLLSFIPERQPVENQNLVRQIYRTLADGKPASREQLAASSGMTTEAATKVVNDWPKMYIGFDDEGRIYEFGGLGPDPTRNGFRVRGNTLYAWCAWDALFIPPILDETAHVEAICPATQEKIQLTVTPKGVTEAKPETAVMTFALPGMAGFSDTENFSMMKTILFFSSPEAASKWLSENPGPVILSLDEGFELGRTMNRFRFKDVLNV